MFPSVSSMGTPFERGEALRSEDPNLGPSSATPTPRPAGNSAQRIEVDPTAAADCADRHEECPNAYLGVGVSLLVLVVACGQAAVLMQSLSATKASTSSTR
ncbi:hypothetical protein GCM10011504_50540 [Siccirubricoccus deserti]|nr:hypothetical protein GCM10011504_50540 [Siccirubricoccus deserti]